MKYKTFTKNRKINDIKREVKRTYKKITKNCQEVEKEKLLFRKKR